MTALCTCLADGRFGDQPGLPPGYHATLLASCAEHGVLCLACKVRPAALMHDALLGDLPRLLCQECASGETRALARQGKLL